MADRRRIVPDNSTLVAAFFSEKIEYGGGPFDLTRRARPLRDAIELRVVDAFAPEVLHHEFMATVFRKVWPRAGAGIFTSEEAEGQLLTFLDLPIVYVPGTELGIQAWELMRDRRIAPADSWYVACAKYYDAELWLSHDHEDQLVVKAREVHDKVYVLTERRFDGI